jgi:hypothetical protein
MDEPGAKLNRQPIMTSVPIAGWASVHSLVGEKEMTRGSDALEDAPGEAALDHGDRPVRTRRDTVVFRGEGEMYSA